MKFKNDWYSWKDVWYHFCDTGAMYLLRHATKIALTIFIILLLTWIFF